MRSARTSRAGRSSVRRRRDFFRTMEDARPGIGSDWFWREWFTAGERSFSIRPSTAFAWSAQATMSQVLVRYEKGACPRRKRDSRAIHDRSDGSTQDFNATRRKCGHRIRCSTSAAIHSSGKRLTKMNSILITGWWTSIAPTISGPRTMRFLYVAEESDENDERNRNSEEQQKYGTHMVLRLMI